MEPEDSPSKLRKARRSCASVPVEGAVLIVCAALQLVRLAAVDGVHDCRLRRDATPDVAIPRCTPRPQRQRASLVSCHVSVRRGARHLHAAGAAGARQPGQRARDDIRRRVARRRGHGTRACSARRSAQRCAVFVWRVAQQRDSRTQR